MGSVSYLQFICLFLTAYVTFISYNVKCDEMHEHSHEHLHDHGHAHVHTEDPKFRYSRQANEKYAEGNQHEHVHSHSHHHHHEHDYHHEHDHSKEQVKKENTKKPVRAATGYKLWTQAIGATFLISMAPFIILFFIPLSNATEQQPLLKVLLSFAAGGLLGDAFLHLIPHALIARQGSESSEHFHSHSHGHSHGEGEDHVHDMSVGLWVLSGILTFLAVEKFVLIVKGGDLHSHSQGVKHDSKDEHVNTKDENMSEDKDDTKDRGDRKLPGDSGDEDGEKKLLEKVKEVPRFKVAGYLNLAADFAHNFTDGLAIGASFLTGETVGIVTTVTVLLHEVPHEIGDFAILIQSGCSKRKAIFLQLLTAVGALTGTVCSLLAEGAGDAATTWVLPFTAGGFIYVAAVSVLPEVLQDSKPWQSVCELAALIVGVYMMVLIAEYE